MWKWIFPFCRWHVRNQDNKERVRKDEENAKLEEKKEQERIALAVSQLFNLINDKPPRQVMARPEEIFVESWQSWNALTDNNSSGCLFFQIGYGLLPKAT